MNNFRRFLINHLQRFHRRLNPAYLEGIYQTSYLDLAKRTSWLDDYPLASPNGGTASFSLLYIIMSILKDQQVTSLMELGVGQSSSLLIQYTNEFNGDLTLVDDNDFWLKTIVGNHENVNAIYAELSPCSADNKSIDWYGCECPDVSINFLLVDGPMAYSKDIRYNRYGVLNWLPEILDDEFIIIIDDTNRVGEYQLVRSIMKKLKDAGIEVGMREIVGGNAQTILATNKYIKYLYL